MPVFAESSCTRDCAECNACVVILIQLGCDVIRELEPMRNAILDVIGKFKAWIANFETLMHSKTKAFKILVKF